MQEVDLAGFDGSWFVAATSATHAQVVNLVKNPSFEEDEVILDDPAWDQWATWGYEGGLASTIAFDDTQVIDGARSLRIMPKGDTNWYFIVLSLPIPLQVGTTYTASFWAKAEGPRPLTVQFKDTANKPVTWGLTDFQLTTDWAEYSMTSPAQDAEMKIEFFCSGSEVPFWMDFVNVYEGEYVAGVTPSGAASPENARRPEPADDADRRSAPDDSQMAGRRVGRHARCLLRRGFRRGESGPRRAHSVRL